MENKGTLLLSGRASAPKDAKRRKGNDCVYSSKELIGSDPPPQGDTVLVRRPRLARVKMTLAEGLDVDVLLDSCSSISLVSTKLINQLNLQQSLDNIIHNIKGSVPGVQCTKGGISLTLLARVGKGFELSIKIYAHVFDVPCGIFYSVMTPLQPMHVF